jgi:hypothetical protein
MTVSTAGSALAHTPLADFSAAPPRNKRKASDSDGGDEFDEKHGEGSAVSEHSERRAKRARGERKQGGKAASVDADLTTKAAGSPSIGVAPGTQFARPKNHQTRHQR